MEVTSGFGPRIRNYGNSLSKLRSSLVCLHIRSIVKHAPTSKPLHTISNWYINHHHSLET